jgi:hypothetical protein
MSEITDSAAMRMVSLRMRTPTRLPDIVRTFIGVIPVRRRSLSETICFQVTIGGQTNLVVPAFDTDAALNRDKLRIVFR